MKKTVIYFLLTLASVFTLRSAGEKIGLPLRFDHYYSYEQVVEALKALNAGYPDLTRLEVIGKSEEGREIYALTINNSATGDDKSKPGVYVDGNIHGNEIQAGEVCLYLAQRLLSGYKENESIKKVVDKNTWFIVPVINVDGRAHFFNDPNTSSSGRSIRIKVDDDRDGLVDEDFPDDLDGDGNICVMRKKDPFGMYKTDPVDPRLMIPVKPGEKGEWSILGQEGIDNDGDGRINEDSEGYLDGNRNWGANWAPPYVQSGSGNFPFSSVTIRSVAKWILERPNIIMVYAFHNSGGMFLRGPSLKSADEFLPGDLGVYNYLGTNSEKIVPGYRYLISWKDLYATYGDFTDFTNNVVGAYGFVGELTLGNSETYSGKPLNKPEEQLSFEPDNNVDRERLKFNDNVVQGELYMPWKKYDHPQYGEIEIGGWVKMSSRLPHPFMLQDMVHRVSSAVIFSAQQTPDVTMEIISKKSVGKGLFEVTVRLSNSKAMPTITYQAVKDNIHPKDILKVSGNDVKVVSGGMLTDIYTNQVSYKENRPEIQFLQVPGFGKVDYRFIISGKGKVKFEYESLKAGKKSTEVTF